jgi:hypothetical protein
MNIPSFTPDLGLTHPSRKLTDLPRAPAVLVEFLNALADRNWYGSHEHTLPQKSALRKLHYLWKCFSCRSPRHSVPEPNEAAVNALTRGNDLHSLFQSNRDEFPFRILVDLSIMRGRKQLRPNTVQIKSL